MPKQLQIFIFLAVLFAVMFSACSNSEYVEDEESEFVWDDEEYENEEDEDGEKNNGTEVDTTKIVKKIGKECFDSFRLPKLDLDSCKEKFFAPDTVSEFPESGFFQKAFTIVFPDNKPMNCEIGGKPPTGESPAISILQIDSSMTIRCADFSENATSNTEIIRTYILEKKPTIPAVFITTDPKSLFDPDTGIYMEGPNAEKNMPHYGANYWLDKEIPIFVELLEKGASIPGFAKHAGLKIFGNWSRVNAKKSVAITFREKYGDKRLHYNLFPNFSELTSFKSFILRNNGQNFQNDYIRDRLVCSLSEGLGIDYQQGRYTIVYYNGKYFGIHDLRERSNEHYFETHYGINHNNINLLKANDSASAGSPAEYIALIEWIKEHSLSDEANYSYVSSKIDISNYINYMLIETFANNRDWPGNNLKKWNTISPNSQWKWFLYDMDQTFNNKDKNTFEYILAEHSSDWANAPKHTFLFRSLMKNSKFKDSFINRMLTLIQTNFQSSQIISFIEDLMSEIKSEIPRDQKRWSLSATKMNGQLNVITKFATERQAATIQNLRNTFDLGDLSPVTFSVKGEGFISIHGTPISSYPIKIRFFEKSAITISATPKTGHTWSNWSDGNTNATRTITPKKVTEITAFFK